MLDIGAGQQPYRSIVEEAGGEYVPYDAPGFPGSVATMDTTGQARSREFDSILCTQVVQYQETISTFLLDLRMRYRKPAMLGDPLPPGYLVLTWPTNWPEVEEQDLYRYTKAGMQRILVDAGFKIITIERRASVWNPYMEVAANKRTAALNEEFALGYGVVAAR